MKTVRLLLAMPFMSAFLFSTSLYAQQEIDPTWYNPWAAPNQATSQTAKPPVAKHKSQPKSISGSPKRQSGSFARSDSPVSQPSHPESRPQPSIFTEESNFGKAE
jgi:hypothetical protein